MFRVSAIYIFLIGIESPSSGWGFWSFCPLHPDALRQLSKPPYGGARPACNLYLHIMGKPLANINLSYALWLVARYESYRKCIIFFFHKKNALYWVSWLICTVTKLSKAQLFYSPENRKLNIQFNEQIWMQPWKYKIQIHT